MSASTWTRLQLSEALVQEENCRSAVVPTCLVLKMLWNVTSERSVSTLRRVKTYLRNTMGQERLNNLMILNAHKEITDSLDLDAIANEFIVNTEHR